LYTEGFFCFLSCVEILLPMVGKTCSIIQKHGPRPENILSCRISNLARRVLYIYRYVYSFLVWLLADMLNENSLHRLLYATSMYELKSQRLEGGRIIVSSESVHGSSRSSPASLISTTSQPTTPQHITHDSKTCTTAHISFTEQHVRH